MVLYGPKNQKDRKETAMIPMSPALLFQMATSGPSLFQPSLLQAVKDVNRISYTLIAILRAIDEMPNAIIVVTEKIPVMLQPHEVSDKKVKIEKMKRALRGGLRSICGRQPGTELVRYLVYDPEAKEVEIDLKDACPQQAS